MKIKLKNHILQVFFLAFLIQFNLTGCDLVKWETQTPTPMFNDWISRFLEEKICKLPCWEGIAPGKTTINEAADLLKKDPAYKNVSDPVLAQRKPVNYYFMNWLTSKENGGGMAWEIEGEGYVSKITLSLQNENPKVILNDLFIFFGNPDSLIIDETRGNICVVHIFYVHKGMEAMIVENCVNKKANVFKDNEIYEISLYPLQDPGFPEVRYWLSDVEKYITAWNGYGKYAVTRESK